MNKESTFLLKQHFDTALESPDGIKKTAKTHTHTCHEGKAGQTRPQESTGQ